MLGGRTRRQLVGDAGKASLAATMLGGLAGGRAAAQEPVAGPPPLPTGGGWTNAEYWAFADWAMQAADTGWNEGIGFYGGDIRTSAAMLSAHSVAALAGYTGGPTRNDARAVRMATQLVQSPPFKTGNSGTTNPRSSSQLHAPGWTMSPTSATADQHCSVDPKVAEALGQAWLARDALGLDATTVALIGQRISETAGGVFFKYPNMRLNQVNWYLELYVWAGVTTGDTQTWMGQYRDQLQRWCAGAVKTTDPWEIPNLSPSWSFHRDPLTPLGAAENIESNEYACIILDALTYLGQVEQAGLTLGAQEKKVLKAWSKRALSAYFTHSGYANWDTGLYLQRWHLGRYWAWMLGGLFAVMLNDEQQSDPRDAQIAKYLLDRAFSTYTRWATLRGQAVPQSPTYPVKVSLTPNLPDFASRFVYLAARAVYRDVQAIPTIEPGPMYAYDPSIGRLTITTPSYNTAIIAQSNGAFPYGGIDLCRLADSDQRVASSIGGTGNANFGVTVLDGGKRVVASAVPRTQPGPPPLTMTKGPRGPIKAGASYPDVPYAGTFETIEVTGTRSGGGATIRTTNTFASTRLGIAWQVTGADGKDVEAYLPSYGRGAAITAVTTGGRSIGLTASSGKLDVTSVAYFWIQSATPETGYVVVPKKVPTGATTAVTVPAVQSSAPVPGPTLIVRMKGSATLTLEVAIAIAGTSQDAATVARALGG